ncbi:MAG TPA: hypothetical protein VFS63_03170 [Pseudolabrys sp.]|nr:hypothetical protein [Pseudolabrys sp.]
MANEKTTAKPVKVPIIPLAFALFLIAGYIYVVLIPAFSKADGVPEDLFALIAQPALIVVGIAALIWGRSWFDRKTGERK